MKTILVTGATSFIGINLIKEILKEYKVIAVVRPNSEKILLLPESKNLLVLGLEMKDYYKLPSLIKEPIHAIVHLSWGGTRGIDRNDIELQERNLKYSIDILHSAVKLNANIFMSAGSQAEYGLQNEIISENTVPEPVTAYGKSKLKFYEYGIEFCKNNNIKFVEPRFFSLYGTGDYEGTLIMSMLDKMLKNEPCDLTYCTQKWNFLNIKDAVAGMKILLESKLVKSGAYNFASTDTRELKNFLLEMKNITNSKSQLNFGALPHNDNGKYGINPDITKLLNTGWQPKISFKDGIREIIENKVK
mgnify:CR=1 FL=1